MRMTPEEIAFEVRLDYIYGILPSAPQYLKDKCLSYSKAQQRSNVGIPAYLGIDPEKQNLEKLTIPLPIVGEEGEHVVVAKLKAFPGNKKGSSYVKRRFPRYGIIIKNDEIVAITQSVKEDMNVINKDRSFLDSAFHPDSLATAGPYKE